MTSHALAHGPEARGVDVTTALQADMVERDDEEHLEFVTSEGRALYSFNVGDFHELHTTSLTQGKSHSGIVLARQQAYPPSEQLRRLLNLVSRCLPKR